MAKTNLLVKCKDKSSKESSNIDVIKEKLSDPVYIEDAVNRLAVVITEQLLSMGGIQNE